jgi:hypothetical protein
MFVFFQGGPPKVQRRNNVLRARLVHTPHEMNVSSTMSTAREIFEWWVSRLPAKVKMSGDMSINQSQREPFSEATQKQNREIKQCKIKPCKSFRFISTCSSRMFQNGVVNLKA